MNVLALLFLILGLFSLSYVVVIITYSGINTAFLWFWFAAFLGCIVLSFIFRLIAAKKLVIGGILKIGFLVLMMTGILLFTLAEGIFIYYGSKEPHPGADYVIVLGAQVRGTTVSRALKNRLDTAYDYLAENKSASVIVSGGQGAGEDITEARAMYDYLIVKGIAAERIIMEEKSVNTYENLLFSNALMKQKYQNIVIVTNRFHVFRAVSIARKLGMTRVYGLGAPSDDRLALNYYVREFFAVLKDKLVGNL